MLHQVRAVGLLTHLGKRRPNFLGSAVAYRDQHHFLTAAHCVTGLDPSEVAVALVQPGPAPRVKVESIIRHATTDVAVLATESTAGIHPFRNYRKAPELGEQFVAFGYPEDVFGPDARQPTARLFRGHYQRFYRHQSHLGFVYEAAELSIPAPGGLSGGPVFLEGSMDELVGIVTENHESTTVLDAVEEIQAPGRERKEIYRKVINYGVAAMLYDVGDWLDQQVPWG